MKKIITLLTAIVLLGTGCRVNETNTVQLPSGLAFDIPQEWKILEVSENEVRIQTDDEPYVVVETVSIQMSAYEAYEEELIEETDGAKIYMDPCGGAFACYKVEVAEKLYSIIWKSPESNQKPPEKSDGIWIPNVNFNRDDILTIMKTIRKES